MFQRGQILNPVHRIALIGMCFLLLSSCADPHSTKHLSLSEGQTNLPEDGYWLCRLDFVDGEASNSLYSFESYRSEARSMITGQCESQKTTKKICARAITQGKTQCVRAKNIGGVVSRKRKAYCTISFDNDLTLSGQGATQVDAAKEMIQNCLSSDHKDSCTQAILNDEAKCMYL